MLNRLKWITYLSLDAPLVAVCWQALLARSFDVALSWYHSLIILASVWLGYAADRWLDNQSFAHPRSERHRFHAKHEARLKRVWLGTFAATALASLVFLSASELTKGVLLLLGALAYAAFAQKGRHLPYYGVAKSVFIAILLVESAVLFIPVSATPLPSGLFALLALAALLANNCLLIRFWSPRKSGPTEKLLRVTGFTSLGIALFVSVFWSYLRPLSLACLLSLGGLFLLSRLRRALDPELSRTLADLMLLTPILVYPFV